MTAVRNKITVKVVEKSKVNDLVTRFSFERIDGASLPSFSGGAHIVVEMKDGEVNRLNPYSLMSNPMNQSRYSISVRRDDEGRGGSLFMHHKVNLGDKMVISYPVNLFAMDLRAHKHLMIAGGIGITPFLAQIKQLSALNGHFELHYSCRSHALGSYAEELTAKHPDNVHVYYDDHAQKIDLDDLLNAQPLGTHIYVCGPKGMIKWVYDTALEMGWPQETIHYEEFLAPPSGEAFFVNLAISKKTIEVGEQQSLLEAIEAAGVDAPYLCRGGACGQCETPVMECDGDILHNDHWLDDEQKREKTFIMPCVSRFVGSKLVLKR
ncbi:PDR/VanB family oxidoreductase [Alphaproteobacteria bacterium]|nr:PDR/VanB family oxidoreductase [Alphaproteobacteria bacterium]